MERRERGIAKAGDPHPETVELREVVKQLDAHIVRLPKTDTTVIYRAAHLPPPVRYHTCYHSVAALWPVCGHLVTAENLTKAGGEGGLIRKRPIL